MRVGVLATDARWEDVRAGSVASRSVEMPRFCDR